MKTKNSTVPVSSETQSPPPTKEAVHSRETGVVGRRSFLRKMGIAGASLAPVTALLLNEGNDELELARLLDLEAHLAACSACNKAATVDM